MQKKAAYEKQKLSRQPFSITYQNKLHIHTHRGQ